MEGLIPMDDIIEIKNFLSLDDCKKAIFYMENGDTSCPIHKNNECDNIALDDTARKNYLSFDEQCLFDNNVRGQYSEDFSFYDISQISKKMQKEVSLTFKDNVRMIRLAMHRYHNGASQKPHLDHYPYAAILYLNDNYEGGELYFPDTNISFKPNAGSLYMFLGQSNIHGVSSVNAGRRYTIVTFWEGERLANG